MKISEKSLEELEFPSIRKSLVELCYFEWSKKIAAKLKPINHVAVHKHELICCNEVLNAVKHKAGLPSFYVDEITTGLDQLKINDYQVEAACFITFLDTVKSFKNLKTFFKKNIEEFPELHAKIEGIEFFQEIELAITKVFNDQGEIKSNASPELLDIRNSLAKKNQEYQRFFQVALNNAAAKGALAETREGLWDGKRVLSILSEFKRQIKGRILGLSKTGKLTYIEPEETIGVSNDIVFLENQEQNEIAKILHALSAEIRPYRESLIEYHRFLSWLDLVKAKANLGHKLQGHFPEINYQSSDFNFSKAYHPILLQKYPKASVVPQEIALNKNERYLVISGPNAGGKSISLKTVGLLQCMLQAAVPIPVAEGSKAGWFKSIHSDIGDNQSLENELSTYSYRLKQMQHFLHHGDKNSLILIDEFGSGSDPELGGALAEVCLEELYQQGGKAVITTHYGNIKVLVDNLPEAVNASMLFDMDSLTPTYKLSVGTAGSSFTFEVAQKMGLSKSILQRSRKKVDQNKLRLDQSLAKVQAYEHELKNLRKLFKEARESKDEAADNLNLRSEYYERQYEQLQEMLQDNEKNIQLGRKFSAFISTYPEAKNKEAWLKSLHEYILKEKVKQKPPVQAKKAAPSKKKVEPEKPSLLSKAKKEKPKKKEVEEIKEVVVGSRVRILGSATKGTVKEINKKEALVEISGFLSKVKLQNLTAV